jgi:hypothetical protein
VKGITTIEGWFNGRDSSEQALVQAEAVAGDEVLLRIDSLAKWRGDEIIGAQAHIDAADAIILGEQLTEAGRAAIVRQGLPQ